MNGCLDIALLSLSHSYTLDKIVEDIEGVSA